MKYLGSISDQKDMVTKKYVDDNGSSAAVFSATFLTTGWASSNGYYTQTVNVAGMLATYSTPPQADCVLSGTDASADAAILEGFACIHILSTGNGTLTAKCAGAAPSVNVPVKVVCFG